VEAAGDPGLEAERWREIETWKLQPGDSIEKVSEVLREGTPCPSPLWLSHK
jgi:hypothetical protein